MAVNKPGDILYWAPLAIQNDAGPIARAESIEGGFSSLPGVVGPPTAALIPIPMRRVGELAYTELDNKFWQLIGGTADVNWVEKPSVGNGGLITVVDNSARDAISPAVRAEGMIVYSKSTKVYYALGPDLTTWRAIGANPSLATQTDWWVSTIAVGASDDNDGTAAHPLLTPLAVIQRINPSGGPLRLVNDVVVHFEGDFASFEPYISPPADGTFKFTIQGSFTTVVATLTAVIDTVVGTPGSAVRGKIQIASGTLVSGQRIRSTSGANVGAITYVDEVITATQAWVKQWVTEANAVVNIANSTTVAIDTLTASVTRLQTRITGAPIGGQIIVRDMKLPRGWDGQNTTGGSASYYAHGCLIGNAAGDQCRVGSNIQLRNCRWIGLAAGGHSTLFGPSAPVLSGCQIETEVTSFAVSIQLAIGNSFVGAGRLKAGSTTGLTNGQVQLGSTQWTNGSTSPAVTILGGSRVDVIAQQFSFGTPYAVGFSLAVGAHASSDTIAHLGINATTEVAMPGVTHTYAQLSQSYPLNDCSFTITGTPSTVAFTAPPVTSVFGRIGAIAALLNDYTSSLVQNLSSVTGGGSTVTSALNALQTQIAASVSGVSSVFGRSGAVAAAAGDYTDAQINNTSTVAGTHVKDALDALKSSVVALVTGVSSVYGRTGAVVAAVGDYTDAQVNNTSTVSGTRVKDALDTLKTSIAALVTGVSSVYGRAGAVVAAAGDYNSTQVNNSSGVTGSTVTAALNTLNSAIGALVTGVSSFKTRTGAVVPASGDYTDAQVDNTSTVTGAHVSDALTNLKASIAALVTGVSSVYGRTGAVVAAAGDYTSSLVNNASTVAGSTVSAALDTLLGLIGVTYSSVRSATSTTLVLSDARGLIRVTGFGVITIPTNASVAFAQFAEIDLVTTTTSGILFSPASGAVNLRTPSTFTNTIQWAKYRLVYLGADEWLLTQELNAGRAIVDSMVSAAAAIAGTKIAPAFGTQNISNTGDINNTGNITSSGTVQAAQFGDGTTGLVFEADALATPHDYLFNINGSPVVRFGNGSFVSYFNDNRIGLNNDSDTTLNSGNSTASGALASLTIKAKDGIGSGTYKGGTLALGGGSGSTGSGSGGDVVIAPGAGIVAAGNAAIGDLPASFQSMQKGIFILNAVAVPTGNPSGGGFLYVDAGALKYRGSSGTVTTLGPA